jgi:hypothetical protein
VIGRMISLRRRIQSKMIIKSWLKRIIKPKLKSKKGSCLKLRKLSTCPTAIPNHGSLPLSPKQKTLLLSKPISTTPWRK